jgi:hypothetical protein
VAALDRVEASAAAEAGADTIIEPEGVAVAAAVNVEAAVDAEPEAVSSEP